MRKNNKFVFLQRLCILTSAIFSFGFVFAGQDSQNSESIAYTTIGDKSIYYDSLDTLFSEITTDTKVVILRDCNYQSSIIITNKIDLSSESPNKFSINLSTASNFSITNNASLRITNINFKRDDADEAPFRVNGGDLTFGEGTKIANILMTKAGNIVKVYAGTFTMLDDSEITNCEATGQYYGSGGAVSLYNENCTFNFLGGKITECSSSTYGGAIYARKGAKILLGGSATAINNIAGSDSRMADIYIVSTDTTNDPILSINDDFTGKIGVYYMGRTDISNSFAVVSTPSVSSDYFKEKIINSYNTSLYATLSDDGKTLIWNQETIDNSIKPLPDENGAEAKVLNNSSVTYYAKISDALMLANDGEKVELLNDAVLSDNVTLKTDVIFDGCGHTLSRDGNFLIDIGEKSLLVTNIVLDGSKNNFGRFFNVERGSLTFEDGAILKNVTGNTADFLAPIVVSEGSFIMNGGEIRNCENRYIPELGDPLTAGALIISGGDAYLNDGLITECVGARAGGAGFYNKSTAYVSDKFTILMNSDPNGKVCNLVIQALSKMTVTNNVVGKIGCSDGYLANTNIAAYVDNSFASSATPEDLVASALRFRHDMLDVKAVPVTDGTETLFVWRTALGEDGNYTTKIDGVEKVYEQITFPLEDPDFVECPPFAFTSIKESDDNTEWIITIKPVKEYCKYTFYTSSDLKNWEIVYRTEAISKDSISSDDEYVFKSARDGKKRFWRAEGKDGLK